MTDTLTDQQTATWRITWRGRTWGESDLTGRHLSVLSLLTGRDDFDQLDMDPRQGHQRLMMMITACLVVDAGGAVEDPDEVATKVAQCMDEVSSAPVEEILGSLTQDMT